MVEYTELKTVPLFAECSEHDLEELLKSPYNRKCYRAGDLVLRDGMPCLSLILLTTGSAESRMVGTDGREVVIERMMSPHILAPAFLFGTESNIPVNVTMLTDGIVWLINREGFLTFMTSHPAVLRRFLRLLSDRSQFLSGKVRSFAVQSLRNRVLDYLEEHGSIGAVGSTAEVLGVLRPSLSRVLADLQTDGLIVHTEEGFVRCQLYNK